MEKKPVYESPKVSRLDEKEAVLGGLETLECISHGSGAIGSCRQNGQSAGQDVEGEDACLNVGNSALQVIFG